MKQFVTRRDFKKWLIERWDQTIGVQNDPHACAIAQFVIEKIPGAEPDIGGKDECQYYDSKKEEYVTMPEREWVQKVIEKFDDLPGTPKGADLLKALGWTGKHT